MPDAVFLQRWEGEALYDYLERMAVASGWMEPLRGRPIVRDIAPAAVAREPGQEG